MLGQGARSDEAGQGAVRSRPRLQSGDLRRRDLIPAFDALRAPEQSIVDDCVHCGFCLDSCPTYVLWANEADSPRGRIVLVDEALNTRERLSSETVTHFDRCLGCMACVSACPSGVRYDRLIERVRPQVERHHRRPLSERALRGVVFATLPYPRRLRSLAPMLALARALGAERMPGPFSNLVRIAPRAPLRRTLAKLPQRTPARGRRRGRVGLLLGCVQRAFFTGVHRATIGVLAAEGFEVLAPATPDCCGALHLHAGEERAATDRARAAIGAFGGCGPLDHIIVNSAGCGSAMKEYGELLGSPEARAFADRVRDVSELLASVEPVAPRGPVHARIAYHDACHLAHAQRIRHQPRALLEAIPALDLVEVGEEAELCCGSAGIYNILQPRAADDLGTRKARHILATGADAVAVGNPGCAAQLDLHLRELGRPLPIHHPVELLWRSIRAGAAD